MNKQELINILEQHKEWLNGTGGKRADFQGAYLQGANLQGAYLQGAYLQRAYLQRANLQHADFQGANLQRANLRGAYLQGANLQRAYLQHADFQGANLQGAYLQGAYLHNTILESINWLIYIGIIPSDKGIAYAYKVTNSNGEGPFNGGINYTGNVKFEVSEVDPDLYKQCSYGINLSTFRWCLESKQDGYRLFLFKFNVADSVCPIASDGKFRVKKCHKIGECDWNGNLLNERQD